MRKITLIAAAFAMTLASCEETPDNPVAQDQDSAAIEVGASIDATDENTVGAESLASQSTSPGTGEWLMDTHECSAFMERGDSTLKIQQTDSDLIVQFAPAWAASVDGRGELAVNGEQMTYETTDGQGHDWVVVTTPNEEFGGLHDIVANAQSIDLAYSGPGAKQTQSFSLAGSNAAMRKLLKCAGL